MVLRGSHIIFCKDLSYYDNIQTEPLCIEIIRRKLSRNVTKEIPTAEMIPILTLIPLEHKCINIFSAETNDNSCVILTTSPDTS
jgi:hypothetical protein